MDQELECRVCRGGNETGKPLVAPCLCSGSIMYCHQSCLEEWLEHSKKDKCELCGSKYVFKPLYAPNTPNKLGSFFVLRKAASTAVMRWCPLLFQMLLVLGLWFVFPPLIACRLYRFFLRGEELFGRRDEYPKDLSPGISLVGTILVSFIVMLSFVEFIRSHWHLEPPNEQQNNQRLDILNIPVVEERPPGVNDEPRVEPPRGEAHGANVYEDVFDENIRMEEELGPSFDTVPHEHTEASNSSVNTNVIADQIDVESEVAVDSEDLHMQEHFMDYEGEDGIADFNTANEDEFGFDPVFAAIPGQEPVHEEPENPVERDAQEDIFAADGEFEDEDFGIPNDVDIPDEMNDQGNAPANPPRARPQAAGNEQGIPIQIDEILGVRQPKVAFVNIARFSVFIAAYLFTVVVIPYFFGSRLSRYISVRVILFVNYVFSMGDEYLQSASPATLATIKFVWSWIAYILDASFQYFGGYDGVRLVNSVLKRTTDRNPTIWLQDIAMVAIGYAFFSIFAGIIGVANSVLSKVYLKDELKGFTKICKVGSLLFLRILILPLLLGFTLLTMLNNHVCRYSVDEIAEYFVDNIIGSVAVCWVSGITFMLVVTLSILQLREVLHPDIIAKTIRPQETQVELMLSLMFDGGFVHAKRMFSSGLVYLAIAVLFIYIPLKLFSWLRIWMFGAYVDLLPVYRPRTWYFAPEVQLPFELTILHLVLLAALEKRKNIIGRVQFFLLTYFCEKLGISRSILPYALKLRPLGIAVLKKNRKDICKNNVDVLRDYRYCFILDKKGNPIVVGPIKRPPVGWDSRVKSDVARWAWGDNPKHVVELTVAPRVFPKYWGLRVLVLMFIFWLIIATCIIFNTVVPLTIGHFIVDSVIKVPYNFQHDLFCTIGGLLLLREVFNVVRFGIYDQTVFKCWNTIKGLSSEVQFVILRLLFKFMLASFAIGIVVSELAHVGNYVSRMIGFGELDSSMSVLMPLDGYTLLYAFVNGYVLLSLTVWAIFTGLLARAVILLQMVNIWLGMIGFGVHDGFTIYVPDWSPLMNILIKDLKGNVTERILLSLLVMELNLFNPILSFFSLQVYQSDPNLKSYIVGLGGASAIGEDAQNNNPSANMSDAAGQNSSASAANARKEKNPLRLLKWLGLILSITVAVERGAANDVIGASTLSILTYFFNAFMLSWCIVIVISILIPLFYYPTVSFYRRLHDTIRDDCFLIGKELQSAPQHAVNLNAVYQ